MVTLELMSKEFATGNVDLLNSVVAETLAEANKKMLDLVVDWVNNGYLEGGTEFKLWVEVK